MKVEVVSFLGGVGWRRLSVDKKTKANRDEPTPSKVTKSVAEPGVEADPKISSLNIQDSPRVREGC